MLLVICRKRIEDLDMSLCIGDYYLEEVYVCVVEIIISLRLIFWFFKCYIYCVFLDDNVKNKLKKKIFGNYFFLFLRMKLNYLYIIKIYDVVM